MSFLEENINKVHHSECVAFMNKMSAESVDMVLTSPPYDDLRKYKGYVFDFEKIAGELVRILKPGGIIVWVVGDKSNGGSETGTSFKQALYFMGLGLNLHDTMIYRKLNPMPNGTQNRYRQAFEYMFVFSKGMPKTANILMQERSNKNDDRRTHRVKHFNRGKDGDFKAESKLYLVKPEVKRTNIWEYFVGLYKSSNDKEAFEHPAMFPEQLAEDHILSWSNEGDIVFDPMVGSGTTAKMALKNRRNFIACDISEEYVKIARCRIGKGIDLFNHAMVAE